MTEQEAQQMAALLARVVQPLGGRAEAYVNAIGQHVVRVLWSTGRIHFVSVRASLGYVEWLASR